MWYPSPDPNHYEDDSVGDVVVLDGPNGGRMTPFTIINISQYNFSTPVVFHPTVPGKPGEVGIYPLKPSDRLDLSTLPGVDYAATHRVPFLRRLMATGRVRIVFHEEAPAEAPGEASVGAEATAGAQTPQDPVSAQPEAEEEAPDAAQPEAEEPASAQPEAEEEAPDAAPPAPAEAAKSKDKKKSASKNKKK